MPAPRLKALRFERQRRARFLRPVVLLTLSVGGVMLLFAFVMPGFSSCRPPPSTTLADAAPALARAEPAPPLVRIGADTIDLDGATVARTDDIDGLRRIDALYDGLRRRREESLATHPGEPPRRVLLAVDKRVRALVVKGVFQTAAFAGYDDVAFVLEDGGVVESQ